MFDERRGTLLRPARRFPGRPRWKGLFKESLGSFRTRWKPEGAHDSGGGYRILKSVFCSAYACMETVLSCRLYVPHPLSLLVLPSTGSHPGFSSHTPLGANRLQHCFLLDVYTIWQVNSTTSHSHSDSQPVINTALVRQGRIPSRIIIYLGSEGRRGEARWAFADSGASERGVLPSGPRWDQHNTSA